MKEYLLLEKVCGTMTSVLLMLGVALWNNDT
jgi:hypothetical protein